MQHQHKLAPGLALCTFLLVAGVAAGQGRAPGIPDFTKGEKHSEKHDWNLGPTGMRGYVPGYKLETIDTRQVLVASVAQGSPADGVMRPGDVTIGVDGQRFRSDVRRCYAAAITRAETEKGRGRLDLLVWRQGKVLSKRLQLPVLGSWSLTSPANCPKAERVVAQAAGYARRFLCAKVDRKGRTQLGGIDAMMAALGLLATGRPEYLRDVETCARYACRPEKLKTVDIGLQQGLCSWSWGYTNLFLAEYYLATHDVNGKNATAAIIFDLQGESAPARFFASMATACHRDKERGHTRNYSGSLLNNHVRGAQTSFGPMDV